MIVDVTEFRHSPGAEVAPWRGEHMIPRYNAAGVKKFAFLVPAERRALSRRGASGKGSPRVTFPTGYFGDCNRIEDWFAH
jgi:hypothetical protein